MNLTARESRKLRDPVGVSQRQYIYVTDRNLCTGCRNCELVCSLLHDGQCSSSLARIHVAKDLFSGEYDVETCRQCKDAPCLVACPVEGALTCDEKTGAKVIDKEKCIGCRACEEACVFASSRSRIVYTGEKNICLKCDLCDGDPQCVKVCPVKILAYGVSK